MSQLSCQATKAKSQRKKRKGDGMGPRKLHRFANMLNVTFSFSRIWRFINGNRLNKHISFKVDGNPAKKRQNSSKFWLKLSRCWRSVVLPTLWRHNYSNRTPSQSCAPADLLAVSVLKRWSLLIIYTPESFCCCYVPWINEESDVSAQLVSDQCTLASRLAERERSLNI